MMTFRKVVKYTFGHCMSLGREASADKTPTRACVEAIVHFASSFQSFLLFLMMWSPLSLQSRFPIGIRQRFDGNSIENSTDANMVIMIVEEYMICLPPYSSFHNVMKLAQRRTPSSSFIYAI